MSEYDHHSPPTSSVGWTSQQSGSEHATEYLDRDPLQFNESVWNFSEPAVPDHRSPAVEAVGPLAVVEEEVEKEAIAERDWVPKDFTDAIDFSVNAATKRSLRSNQLSGTSIKCSVVINRDGQRFPMFVEKNNTDLSLKFAFIGGSDNPTLELSLKAGDLPRPSLPDAVTISPKDGYLTVQFPLLPINNDDLKVQMDRRVVESTQDDPRTGRFNFSPSVYNFEWKKATEIDLEDSGLPEEAMDLAASKSGVIMLSFTTRNPITFGFELADLIKSSTDLDFAHRLVDAFRLLQLDVSHLDLSGLGTHINDPSVVSLDIEVYMRDIPPLVEAWKRALSAPLGLPANWRYGRHDNSDYATVSSMTVFFDQHMDGERPPNWRRDGGLPQEKAVLLQTKTSFAHLREYESTVTASYLKDQQAPTALARKLFNRTWPAALTPVDHLLPNADTSMVLVLFNVQLPAHDNRQARVPLPTSGDQVSLRFPQSLQHKPAQTPYEEVWLGVVINVPLNVDEFNMAALVRRPDGSKVTVLNFRETNSIHFEFGHSITSESLEALVSSLLYSKDQYMDTPRGWWPRLILGRHNFEEPEFLSINANMTPTDDAAFQHLADMVTSNNNASQNSAIRHALNHRITLIEGPPGTGKSTLIRQLVQIFHNTGRKVLVLAPSNSATEHNADLNASTWRSAGQAEREMHWVRKVADERSTLSSSAIHGQFAQPPGRLHIIGLPDADNEVLSFFKDEIVENSLGDPHELSLKARILSELSRLSLKPDNWESNNANEETRALENREYQILTILVELMDNDKRGLYDICATTRRAVRSLGLSIKEKVSGGRAKAIARHHMVFRFVWRLAEQLYASEVSRAVFSTVGNAILSPAFEGADFQAIIIDESTNIAESPIIGVVSRFIRTLDRLVLIGDPNQIPPSIEAPSLSEQSNQVGLPLFQRMALTGVPVQLLDRQYRMHPDISRITHTSSGYTDSHGNSRLCDDESTFNRPGRTIFIEWSRACGLWGEHTNSTSLCLDVADGVLLVEKDGSSKGNHHNAVAVLFLAQSLLQHGVDLKIIMIIAMYKTQVMLIKRLLKAYGINIEVNTVDSSEGKEAEICIVDFTTPLRRSKDLGFLSDRRRINVAFTRARNGRVVLGSKEMTSLDPSTSGGKILKAYAVEHKDKTAVTEIGHQLLRFEDHLRPDKFTIFATRQPATNIYDNLVAQYYPST